jgi:V-type H+-transporting ATPase subunit E
METLMGYIQDDAAKTVADIDREAEEQYRHERDQFVRIESDKLLAQFEKRKQQIGVERHVAKVAATKAQNLRLLDLRTEQMQKVRETARAKLQAIVQQPAEYKSLMLQLLVQGAVAVESDCIVRVRKVDEGLAKGLFAEAESAAKQQLGGKAVRLVLDSTGSLDDAEAWGGAVLTGLNGRIICNNTLASRTKHAFEEQLPTMRLLLFQEKQH